MKHRILVFPVVTGALLFASGCATKTFVREEVQKSGAKLEQRVGQEVGRIGSDLEQEKTRLTGVANRAEEARSAATEATRRADHASGLAGEASVKADDAAGRAGQALTRAAEAHTGAGQALAKADETASRLSRLWANRNKRLLGDTVIVVFGFDKWQLDDRTETALLDVVRQLLDNPNLVVDVEGYTDSAGPSSYNVTLSQRRAEAVRRFLVEKGIEVHRVQSIGLGDIRPIADNRTTRGRDQNRRVAVKLFAPGD